MKGDFSRQTFNCKKHYRSVMMQQGRVQLDSDINEQQSITQYFDESQAADVIGPRGIPRANYNGDGFKVGIANGGKDLSISKGHAYVDGILCENDKDNVTLEKFVNQVMKKGKKTVARKIVYQALDIVKTKTKKEPLEIFDLAIRNASPLLEIKPKRIGGATYQVPREVRGDRKLTLAVRWIIAGARNKKGKPMNEKLANELIEAANNQGAAVKKKEDTHRMAEANRAFAHFTW